MPKHIRSVLITDLDDTLWNWIEIWHASFELTLSEIIRKSGLNEKEAIELIKEIHTSVGTSEYPDLIYDFEKKLTGNDDVADIDEKYAHLFELQKIASEKTMKPFSNVVSSLLKVKETGTIIIGYTESMASSAIDKVKLFNLDGVFDVIYAREDLKNLIRSNHLLKKSELRTLSRLAMKPDKAMLLKIINDAKAQPIDCVYLGDNLIKDIQMAKDADVLDVFAKYGHSKKNSKEYELLKKVTHWPPKDVKIESETTQSEILPSIILDGCISEIFSYINFEKFREIS